MSRQNYGLFLENKVANSLGRQRFLSSIAVHNFFFLNIGLIFVDSYASEPRQYNFQLKRVHRYLIIEYRTTVNLDLTLLVYPDKFFMPHIDIQ